MANVEESYPVDDLGGIYVQAQYRVWWDKDKELLLLAWMDGAGIHCAEGCGDGGVAYNAILNRDQYKKFMEWAHVGRAVDSVKSCSFTS